LPSLRSGTRLRLVESRLKLMQVNLHAAFFFFTSFGCFAPEGFFMRVAVTSFRHSASPRRIPPETYASKLARRFFSFLPLSAASHPRDFLCGLPSLRSGTRLRLVESRRVYHLIKDYNTS